MAAGTPVDLPCRLPPTADLTWSREGGVTLPTAAQPIRNILRLERVADKDSGRYICSSQGRTQYIDLSVERELILILLIFCQAGGNCQAFCYTLPPPHDFFSL